MSATKMYNDLLFIGTYVEYISRRTTNHQVVVMDRIGYDYADIDHCLFMLQHLGEFQEKYNLPTGDYDTSELTRGLPIESPSVGEEMGVLPDKAFDKFWEIHHSWFARDLLDYSKALYSWFIVMRQGL